MTLKHLRRTPRPDFDELLRLKTDYTDWHQRRLMQHREDEDFFKLEYPVPTPDGKSTLISPSAYQTVEELINHVAAELPFFTVFPKNATQSALDLARKHTHWINGVWDVCLLSRLIRQILFYGAIRGCWVFRIRYDPGLWPAKPVPPVLPEEPDLLTATDQEVIDYAAELVLYEIDRDKYREELAEWQDYTEEHFPITPEVIDPQYCFWEPAHDPGKVIVAWDRTVDDIIRNHPEAEDRLASMKPGSKVKWCEFYDDTYYAYWVESYGSRQGSNVFEIQPPTEHGLGFFPFIIDGPWQTPLEDSDMRYPSIYFAIKNMLQYESTLLTQIAHMIRVNGWAPIVVKTDRPEGQKPVVDMNPGHVNYLEETEEIGYLEFGGQTMAVLERLINAVDDYVQKGSGLGDLMRGAPKGKSGYQQAQLASMARVALTPVEHALGRTLQRASRYLIKAVRAVGEKVTVFGHYGQELSDTTLDPKDCRSIGQIEVRLRTVLPIDEGAKIANYANMNKMGWLSRATAARMAGVENPEDEHARWRAEQMSEMPGVREAEVIRWLRENDPQLLAEFQQAQMMQQQQQGGGGPPGAGGPQIGPGGPGGAGGGAQPGQPGRGRPEAPPGSAQEAGLAIRQGRQGGMVPKRLPPAPDDGGG